MLTHIDEKEMPTMVDVTDKAVTKRVAKAQSVVFLPESIWQGFDGKDIQSKKGPVFQTAIVAGTQAAKKTHDLIPFCHPLPIDSCKINIETERPNVIVTTEVRVEAKTGVEMEALVAANLTALTIYDMTKALSQEIEIKSCYLLGKSGGRHEYQR